MIRALRVVPSLLRSEPKTHSLMQDAEAEAVRLGLPREAGPLLLNIINAGERPADSSERKKDRASSDDQVRTMLLQPFKQISWSFRILTTMSVLMFCVGLTFLVVALVKATTEQELSTSTLTIAGVGLADFVLLFYRRPWEDIARGLSNSQQARIIATSYLSGVSILDRSDEPGTLVKLDELTRQAVELLEEYTEPASATPRTRGRPTET